MIEINSKPEVIKIDLEPEVIEIKSESTKSEPDVSQPVASQPAIPSNQPPKNEPVLKNQPARSRSGSNASSGSTTLRPRRDSATNGDPAATRRSPRGPRSNSRSNSPAPGDQTPPGRVRRSQGLYFHKINY